MKEGKLKIENIRSLNNEDYAIISMLYAPLIKGKALEIYLLLNSLVETKSMITNHRFLLETLKISELEFIQERKILEQFLLIRTFSDENKNSLIKIQPPKSGIDFLKHEVFGRLYCKTLGQQMYEFVNVSFAKSSTMDPAYSEISEPFKINGNLDWQDNEEAMFKATKPILETTQDFNFDLVSFLNNCSPLAFPLNARDEVALKEIKELGSIYGVDEQGMILLVARSMDLRSNKLNIQRLKSRILSSYQPKIKDTNNPYELSPVEFLYYKQGGIAVVSADKKIVEDLVRVMKLPNEVVNVLIEYVLNINHQKLDRSYIEKIAGNWVRLKVTTYDEAIAQCLPVTKKQYKTAPKKKLPDWYAHPEKEVEVIDENFDMGELDKALAKMRGE